MVSGARRPIWSGSSFEALAGSRRAVDGGAYVHWGGTTGFDYAAIAIAPIRSRHATSASPTSRPR